MPKRTVHAIKDDGFWYVDDDNGFSKADNQLVAGIPEIIESLMGGDALKVAIEYSDESFPDAVCLNLLSGSTTGSTYRGTVNGTEMEGWLCPVFFHYFKKAPERLYFNFSDI
jgi:hypothetical protein